MKEELENLKVYLEDSLKFLSVKSAAYNIIKNLLKQVNTIIEKQNKLKGKHHQL